MNEARSSGPVIDCEAAAALIEPLTDLVVQAGAAILAVNRPAMKVDGKLDGTPVTEADVAADRIIGEGLARLFPDVPALSEERAHLAKPAYRGSFFLIDPLRVYRQSRAGDPWDAATRHRRRTGAWIGLAGAGGSRRGAARDERVHSRGDSYPHAAETRRPLDRGGQPLASRHQDRSFH